VAEPDDGLSGQYLCTIRVVVLELPVPNSSELLSHLVPTIPFDSINLIFKKLSDGIELERRDDE
jgi:hypothetical protein